MNVKELKKMTPMDRLVHWIKEREAVRLKKEAGEPQPWTDDPIIGTYRFCNVRRMDDKVSKWLLLNWYQPYFNHPNMLYAVALARFINLPDSLSSITDYVFKTKAPDWGAIKTRLRKRRDAGNTIFNGAYMVRGNDGQDKIECVVDHYVKPLNDLPISRLMTHSMEASWTQISSYYGFGSFMAGQIVADLRWAVNGTWEDKMTWAPIGPGSQRGMNRLHQRPISTALKQKDFLTELRNLHAELRQFLPSSIYNRIELHDVQNCLCEYDKMCRVIFGEGRPKQIYRSST